MSQMITKQAADSRAKFSDMAILLIMPVFLLMLINVPKVYWWLRISYCRPVPPEGMVLFPLPNPARGGVGRLVIPVGSDVTVTAFKTLRTFFSMHTLQTLLYMISQALHYYCTVATYRAGILFAFMVTGLFHSTFLVLRAVYFHVLGHQILLNRFIQSTFFPIYNFTCSDITEFLVFGCGLFECLVIGARQGIAWCLVLVNSWWLVLGLLNSWSFILGREYFSPPPLLPRHGKPKSRGWYPTDFFFFFGGGQACNDRAVLRIAV